MLLHTKDSKSINSVIDTVFPEKYRFYDPKTQKAIASKA